MRADGSPPATQLVLSIFPGVDLFGSAFEAEGFCVVRGPDLIWGGDVRRFHAIAGRFDGVIGGPPCPDFSCLRRGPATGYGVEMIQQFVRVVLEARPAWFLMENVPGVPDVAVDGYSVQRIDLRGAEVGLTQRRLRHFQFGSVTARALAVPRAVTSAEVERACVASEGKTTRRRGWAQFCGLMGLDEPLDLPGLSVAAKYRAVGNGVPLPMGRLLARAIRAYIDGATAGRLCRCGCGRPVAGLQRSAGPACRKRLERRRRDAAGVTQPGPVTPGLSRDRARLPERRPVTVDDRIARQYDPAATPTFETVTSRGCFSIAASHSMEGIR